MSVLSSITGVIGLAGKAKQLADQLKNLELKEVIVDLQGKLLDLKEEINKLREENQRLTEDVKRALAPPEVTLNVLVQRELEVCLRGVSVGKGQGEALVTL